LTTTVHPDPAPPPLAITQHAGMATQFTAHLSVMETVQFSSTHLFEVKKDELRTILPFALQKKSKQTERSI
jgi:hypothetical protein